MSVWSRICIFIDVVLLLCILTMPLWWRPKSTKTLHHHTVKVHHNATSPELVFVPLPQHEVILGDLTIWSDHDPQHALNVDIFDYNRQNRSYESLLDCPLQLHTHKPYTRYQVNELLLRHNVHNTLVFKVHSEKPGIYPVYVSYSTQPSHHDVV